MFIASLAFGEVLRNPFVYFRSTFVSFVVYGASFFWVTITISIKQVLDLKLTIAGIIFLVLVDLLLCFAFCMHLSTAGRRIVLHDDPFRVKELQVEHYVIALLDLVNGIEPHAPRATFLKGVIQVHSRTCSIEMCPCKDLIIEQGEGVLLASQEVSYHGESNIEESEMSWRARQREVVSVEHF